jgi:hypothetical protein
MEEIQSHNIDEIKTTPPISDMEIEVFFPRNKNLKNWGVVTLGGLFILGGSLFSVLLIMETYTAVIRHGRAVLLSKMIPILPLLLIVLPAGNLLILYAKNHWDDRIALQENGLFLKKGKKEQFWYWGDTTRLNTGITEIQFGGSAVGTKIKLLLQDENQNHWVIRNQYQEMDDLVEGIRAKVLPHLYDQAMLKLGQGDQIRFHPEIIAAKASLKIKDQSLSWDKIEKPTIKNNKLLFTNQKNGGGIYKFGLQEIENLDLLMCLIDNPPDPII